MADILDHRGEPIRRRKLTREISGPTITGTRSIWTSALTRDITPARMAAILREAEQPGQGASERYVELAEIMEERDLHYLGVISTRKRQVAQIGITVEPASDSAEDVRDADLVRECLDREGFRGRCHRHSGRDREGLLGRRNHLGDERPGVATGTDRAPPAPVVRLRAD